MIYCSLFEILAGMRHLCRSKFSGNIKIFTFFNGDGPFSSGDEFHCYFYTGDDFLGLYFQWVGGPTGSVKRGCKKATNKGLQKIEIILG